MVAPNFKRTTSGDRAVDCAAVCLRGARRVLQVKTSTQVIKAYLTPKTISCGSDAYGPVSIPSKALSA